MPPSSRAIAFLNSIVNNIAVHETAIKSATGSAIYTAIVLSASIAGIMYISGISSTNFLSTATIIEHFALPMDTNVIWHAIYTPNRNSTAQYILSAPSVKVISSALVVKRLANAPGNSIIMPQSKTE